MTLPAEIVPEPPPATGWITRPLLVRVVATVFLLIFALLCVLWVFPQLHDRSFTVQATTLSLDLRFEETVPTSWPLRGAVVCQRHEGGVRRAASIVDDPNGSVIDDVNRPKDQGSSSSPLCNSATHEESILKSSGISWARDSRVKLSYGTGDYPVKVYYVEEPPDSDLRQANDLTINSYLLLSKELASTIGVLRFRAKAIIGDLPVSGTPVQLSSGRFEVWDIPRKNRSPVLTRTGNLLLGDRVSVVRHGDVEGSCTENCQVAGEIIVTFGADIRGMQVVMHAGSHDNLLRVERVGGTVAHVGSSWFDRARKDTLFIAIGSILAVLAALNGAAKALGEFVKICKFSRRETAVDQVGDTEE